MEFYYFFSEYSLNCFQIMLRSLCIGYCYRIAGLSITSFRIWVVVEYWVSIFVLLRFLWVWLFFGEFLRSAFDTKPASKQLLVRILAWDRFFIEEYDGPCSIIVHRYRRETMNITIVFFTHARNSFLDNLSEIQCLQFLFSNWQLK